MAFFRFRKPQKPGDLLTAVIGPASRGPGGWDAWWLGEGLQPRENVQGPTLTHVAQEATFVAAGFYADHPPGPEAELQLAIFPTPSGGGPVFTVTGTPGDFSATFTSGTGESVTGRTLEDLLTAVTTDLPHLSTGSSFSWCRPANSLRTRGIMRT